MELKNIASMTQKGCSREEAKKNILHRYSTAITTASIPGLRVVVDLTTLKHNKNCMSEMST